MTPRPVVWYDREDGERNFEQQVQYTPFTSMLNVTGLPGIVVPVAQTEDGLPMGVQLIGRPGARADAAVARRAAGAAVALGPAPAAGLVTCRPGACQLTGPVCFSPGPLPISSGNGEASRKASWRERRPSRRLRACWVP